MKLWTLNAAAAALALAATGLAHADPGNLLLTGAMVGVMLLADRHVLGWFLPDGSPALENARHLNRIAIGSFIFFGVTFVLSGVVRSTGAVVPPLIILAVAMWGIRVPVARRLCATCAASDSPNNGESSGAVMKSLPDAGSAPNLGEPCA